MIGTESRKDNKAWKEVMLIPCRNLQERSFGETVIMCKVDVQWQEEFIDKPHFSKENDSKHIFTVINILYKRVDGESDRQADACGVVASHSETKNCLSRVSKFLLPLRSC